eukprot:14503879-Ditylum_brightwellii.AAC.1
MKNILTDIPYDEDMASSMMISIAEVRYIDTLVSDGVVIDIHPEYQSIPHDVNEECSDYKSVKSSDSIHTMDDAMVDQLFSE